MYLINDGKNTGEKSMINKSKYFLIVVYYFIIQINFLSSKSKKKKLIICVIKLMLYKQHISNYII